MKRLAAVGILALCAGSAMAQDGGVRMVISTQPSAATQADQVRLNVSMNFFVPGPAGLGDEAMQVQEKARKRMYELVSHECKVLREAIANDCRVDSMNINVNRHQGGQTEGFTIGANATYRITLK